MRIIKYKNRTLKEYDIQNEKLISKEDELENEVLKVQEYQNKIMHYKCKIKGNVKKKYQK